MRMSPVRAALLLAVAAAWSVSAQTYTISTFAGGGLPVNIPGTSAGIYNPQAVAVDKAGNVFFADADHVVLRLDAGTGVLTLVAGTGVAGFSGDDGLAINAQLNNPAGIAVDAAGSVYIADAGNNRIRRVSNGVIATVAGSGPAGLDFESFGGDNGPAANARLANPRGVAVDPAGNLYIADRDNSRIRKVSNGIITTIAGTGTFGVTGDNGPATSAQLAVPGAVAIDSAGTIYIVDSSRIRKVSNGVITTAAGNGTCGFSGDNGPAISAQLCPPGGIALDASGNLYIADGSARIRKVSGGVITTVAGNGTNTFSGDNGPALSAGFDPSAVAIDSGGNLYIADAGNNRIRKIVDGVITTAAGNGTSGFAGDNGPAASAQLGTPVAVAVDSAGSVYIADLGGVRKVSHGVITTVAGNGGQGLAVVHCLRLCPSHTKALQRNHHHRRRQRLSRLQRGQRPGCQRSAKLSRRRRPRL